MSAQMIVSVLFLVLSVVSIVVSFTVLKRRSYSKFIGASACVYASACLMILLFSVFKKDLPILFFILAGGLSTGIFLLTSFMMILLMEKMQIQAVEVKKPEEQEETDENKTDK